MMKHFKLYVFVCLMAAGNVSGGDFYDTNIVNSIEITFKEDNWDKILDRFYAEGEERLIGRVLINGAFFDSVGVKYKGNSSYSSERLKNPLNIKLDHIIDDQEYEGYGTLKLSNGFKDPSFVREVLGYEIARKYTPASKANFINVMINGKHIGLYTSVQSVDKSFLASFFSENDNTFIKGDMVGGMKNNEQPEDSKPPKNQRQTDDINKTAADQDLSAFRGATLQYLGADSAEYYSSYEMRSENEDDWGNLVELCDILNNDPSRIESILNVDRALWHIAFHNILVSLDSPINAPHNFYIYKDSNDLFNYIFWDLNQTFGTFTKNIAEDESKVTIADLQQLDPYHNADNPGYPLLAKLLNNSGYRKIYVAHMKTIIEENFTNGWYVTKAADLQTVIDDHVKNDQNKFYTYDDFNRSIHHTITVKNQTTPGIVPLMEGRIEFLNNHPDFKKAAPTVGTIGYNPSIVLPNTPVTVTVPVDNAVAVTLAYRVSNFSKFVKIAMLDDGLNGDTISGDGVYSVTINTGSSDIQYYVYAENDDAGTFSPARAAYEYYTLPVSDTVVINEFMASNDTTMIDQDGEYDDWIELYNTGDDDISLAGYCLTDDLDELEKWAFPDTTIGAGEFLIVWADGDEEQTGLHTNFKLDASGESLALVDPELAIVDEFIFSRQTSDMSMCRYPDGTGDFMKMTPTFAASNLDTSTAVDESDDKKPANLILMQNFPNPFNGDTLIGFELNNPDNVRLTIYNLAGQEVKSLADGYKQAGSHRVVWDGTNTFGEEVGSGIYIYRFLSDKTVEIKKMTMIR